MIDVWVSPYYSTVDCRRIDSLALYEHRHSHVEESRCQDEPRHLKPKPDIDMSHTGKIDRYAKREIPLFVRRVPVYI